MTVDRLNLFSHIYYKLQTSSVYFSVKPLKMQSHICLYSVHKISLEKFEDGNISLQSHMPTGCNT